MKAVFIILAIAAAVSANPSNGKWGRDLVQGIRGTTASVDKWTMIRFYATETRAIVNFAFDGVKQIAINENQAVGQTVNEYIKFMTPKINANFDNMDREVNAETLNHEKAKAYLSELDALFRDVKVELSNQVAELSEIAKGKIAVTFEYFAKQIQAKEYQILILTLN